ncbi:MAG: hypothetical protein JWR50_259 [Mucilaginibacter sp.]|nr:hypothetical protein [Mucilaginibacter sp.]
MSVWLLCGFLFKETIDNLKITANSLKSLKLIITLLCYKGV